jgi:glyoxylase-like metal-dependent hydrolase (beta-lactamase superfamily II)
MPLTHDRSFEPRHGEPVVVAPCVLRVTAHNPGPFTFHGTNSYLVGEQDLAVIDPGPEDAAHLDALLKAIGGRPVRAILLTHTHRDHSSLAPALKAATGAPILAEGRHRAARPLHDGEEALLDASGHVELVPDERIADGGALAGANWRLTAIATPGHTVNHLAFALEGNDLLFSGDHVMAWSTSIVAPPDGDMAAYMASLARLRARTETRYLPGHGGPVEAAHAYVDGLVEHRRAREAALLTQLERGPATLPALVAEIYRDVDRSLHGAAALSLMAHAEDLLARGAIAAEGLGMSALYRRA